MLLIVSMTILCWVCFGVRKKIVMFLSSVSVNTADSIAAVFPMPVGAWIRICCFLFIDACISDINLSWVFLIESWGKRSIQGFLLRGLNRL